MKWTLVFCAVLCAQTWAKEKHHGCPDRYPSDLAKTGAEKTYNELSEGKSLYQLDVYEAEEGFKPLETHTLGLRSNDRGRMFQGFHVSVTSDDAKCTPGKLKAYHKGVKELKHCNVLINSKDEPTIKVPLSWKAPPCGCVTFRATVIEDKTKYYLDDGRLEDGPLTKTVCAREDVNYDADVKNEMEGQKEEAEMMPVEKYQPKKDMMTVVKEIAEDGEYEPESEYEEEEWEEEEEMSESDEEEMDEEEEEDIENMDGAQFDRLCKAAKGRLGQRPKRMRFWTMMGLCCRYEGDERSECISKAREHVRANVEAAQDRRRPDNRPRPTGRVPRPGRKPEGEDKNRPRVVRPEGEDKNRPRMVRPGSKRDSMYDDQIPLNVEAFRDIKKNPFSCPRSPSFIAPRQTDTEGISALCQLMEGVQRPTGQRPRPPMRRPRPGMRGEEHRGPRPHMRKPRPGMEEEEGRVGPRPHMRKPGMEGKDRPGPRPHMRKPGPGMEERRNRPNHPMHRRPDMPNKERGNRYAEGVKQLAHKAREGVAMRRTQRSAEEPKPALLGHKHEQHRFDKKPTMFGHQHEKHMFDEEYKEVLQDRKEGISRCCSVEGEEQEDCFRSQQKTDMDALCSREDLTTHGRFGLSHPCCQEEEGRRAECFDQERYWYDEEVHETDFTPDLEKFYDSLQDLIDLENPWRNRAIAIAPERLGRYCDMAKKWQVISKEDVPSQFGVFYNWYQRVQQKMKMVECCQIEEEEKMQNCIAEQSRQRVDRYCSMDPKFPAQPAHPCCRMDISEKYQCFAQEKVDFNEEVHSKDFTPLLSDYMEEYWDWLEHRMEEGFEKDPVIDMAPIKAQIPDITSEEEELEEEVEEIEFSDSEMEDMSELDDEAIEEPEEEEEEESETDALRPLMPRLVRKVDCCKAGKDAANKPRTCRNKALSHIGSLPLRTARGKNICQRMFWKCCQRVKRTGMTVAPQPPRVPASGESEEVMSKESHVSSEESEEYMAEKVEKNIPVDTSSSEEDMEDFEEMDTNELNMLENELSDMDIDSVVEEAEEDEEEEEEEGFSPRAPGKRRGKPGRRFVRRCCRVGKRFGRSSRDSCESRAASFVRRMRRPAIRRVCSRVLNKCCEKMPRPTKVPETTTPSVEPATTTLTPTTTEISP
ncbi:uncharacterized protein [Branchiostoma lanceolatum]|uniref:uncharacterized protein isoform X2 n=1 Tax=Branchiostoma lanceolatum TaxID=7740 RepID=UPI003456C3AA